MEDKEILIIEDDPDIAEIERDYLTLGGYKVTVCSDGESGLREGLSGKYDIVLLDLMLPGKSGFDVCRELREASDVPVIMVSARREDIDKIRGFGYGADDYVEKPFSPSVLVARVKAHLSRYERMSRRSGAEHADAELVFDELRLNTDTHRLYVNGNEVPLKNKEYELLCFLMKHPDRVFSREDLYEHIWGLESMGDNITVAVHINRLREKLEDDPQSPRRLQTVWGAGYRFCP